MEVLGHGFHQRRARPRQGRAQRLGERRRFVHPHARGPTGAGEGHEVRIARHHADRGDTGGTHVVADLPEGTVVPHDQRQAEIELHRRHQFLQRELHAEVSGERHHGPRRLRNLGADGGGQRVAEGAVA